MTKLEKLLKIREAYEALIPCVKNNVVQDYSLVLSVAPLLLTELINEEKQAAAAPASQPNAEEKKPPAGVIFRRTSNLTKQIGWSANLIKQINSLHLDESLELKDGRKITCRKFTPPTKTSVGSDCSNCAVFKLGADQFCNMFYCNPSVRYDGEMVYFELTDAPVNAAGNGGDHDKR